MSSSIQRGSLLDAGYGSSSESDSEEQSAERPSTAESPNAAPLIAIDQNNTTHDDDVQEMGPERPPPESPISVRSSENESMAEASNRSLYQILLDRRQISPTEPDHSIAEHMINTLLPPIPSGTPAPTLQARVSKLLEVSQHHNFNENLMSNRSFKNPEILQKLVEFTEINESGSHEVPGYHFEEYEYYDKLDIAQKARHIAPSKKGSVEFVKESSTSTIDVTKVHARASPTPKKEASSSSSSSNKKRRWDERPQSTRQDRQSSGSRHHSRSHHRSSRKSRRIS